jgi:FkbM family methyltransferase
VKGGLRTLVAAIVGRREISVVTPNLRHPLVIRPRTSDRFVFEQIFLDHDYDIPVDLSPRFIVDAGANVGYSTVYFASRYPGARIIALEPEPTNFDLLVRNTRDYPEIIPMKAALWCENEMLSLNNQGESWSHRVEKLNENSPGVVQGITMDALLRQYGRSSIDLLKIDIEGAECEVFSAECRPWLSRTNVLIVEIHDHFKPGCSQALENAISGLDFERMEKGENRIFISRELWASAAAAHGSAA